MSKYLSLWPVLAAVLVICSPDAMGQGGSKVQLRIVSFPKSLDPQPVELVVGEGKTIELETPSNEISKTYTVPAQANWTLGKSGVGEDGKPEFKVYGQARALTASKQLLLLVRKGADPADGMKVIPIDFKPAGFGKGKMLILNAASVGIAGEVGSRKFALKPSQFKIIEPKPDKTGRLCQAVLYYDKEGKPEPFFSSKWPVSDKSQALVFIYHGEENKRLRLHAIRDFLP